MDDHHNESICGPCGASPRGTPGNGNDPEESRSPATAECTADPVEPRSPATLRRREQDPDPVGTESPEATLRAALAKARKSRRALCTGHNVRPAHALRYDSTGWPTAGTTLPPETAGVGRAAARAWEPDGLRLLEAHATAEKVQLLFSAAPDGAYRIAALSVMPDHVHLALRGNIEMSPQEIAVSLQNGLARAAGCRVWQDSCYVGTFSEYDLDVIRRITAKA